MIREVDLIEYLPYFLRNYKQFKYIFNVEDIELNKLFKLTETVKDRSFVNFADETGIKRFEKMLNITPLKNDSLNQRRIRILTKINDGIPYTMTTLKEKLSGILGENNYQINIDGYNFELIVSISEPNLIKTIQEYLKETLPANLLITIRNILNRDHKGKVIVGNPFNVKQKYINIESGFEPNKNYNLSNDLEIITLVDTIKKRS